jgi:hypothetical protein
MPVADLGVARCSVVSMKPLASHDSPLHLVPAVPADDHATTSGARRPAGQRPRRVARPGCLELSALVTIDVLGPPQCASAPVGLYLGVPLSRQHIGEHFEARLCTLSAQCASIAPPLPLPPLSRVGLSFELPGHGLICAIGLVVGYSPWALDQPTATILFEALSTENLLAIALRIRGNP